MAGSERGRSVIADCHYSGCSGWLSSATEVGGLILPSSARVSKLTYQTVIGVRYPELVRPTTNGWQYGRYVSAEATLQGGFLPIFWDVPKSTMHAVSDVGAVVEWLQEHIEFGQDSTENLAPFCTTRTIWSMSLD